MSQDEKFVAISVGPYGYTAHYPVEKSKWGSTKSYLSGYGEPDYTNAIDGCVVIDTRPAKDRKDFVKNVLAAPLLDVELKDDEIDYCPTPSPMLAAGIANNEFGAMLAYHESMKNSGKKIGSLDYVSPSFLAAWWIERGGTGGIVKNGKVKWFK